MKNEEFATQGARTWKSSLHFHFDNTAMPRIVPELGVTKNEIATKVMHSRNAERAVKVMEGGSTDMKDMLLLCERYNIDLAQLLLLPNGEHPVIITRQEYERLKEAAALNKDDEAEDEEGGVDDGKGSNGAGGAHAEVRKEAVALPETRIDNENAASLIGIVRENTAKIAALYERIVELTAENASVKAENAGMKAAAFRAELATGCVGIRQVSDDTQVGE